MGTVLSVVIAVAIPLGAGIGIGLGIQDEVKGWYRTLKKPSWNPPNWVFGPVWSALYTAMGVASWEVWRKGGGFTPLTLYAVQLALNLAWSPIFFKKHELGFALADVTALLGVLSATIVSFHSVSPTAAYLLVPYFGWTLYATGLTFAVYKMNPRHRGTLDHEEGPLKEGIDTTIGTAAHIGEKAQEYGSVAAEKTKEAAVKAKESVPKLDLGGSSSEAKTA
ncbi:g11154 [Coccomyxa viridis]|uniref:G11154 protein n=1 Tax=Coccomyxa viridis TaxID=1274662 RepID=A0ABP1G9T0_9CHLO